MGQTQLCGVHACRPQRQRYGVPGAKVVKPLQMIGMGPQNDGCQRLGGPAVADHQYAVAVFRVLGITVNPARGIANRQQQAGPVLLHVAPELIKPRRFGSA